MQVFIHIISIKSNIVNDLLICTIGSESRVIDFVMYLCLLNQSEILEKI